MSNDVGKGSKTPEPTASFDYVVGLYLLFIAAGMAKMLDGAASLVEHRASHHLCLAHVLVTLLVGMQLMQNAWASFTNRVIKRWRIGTFLLVCSTPCFYFLIASMLFPETETKAGDFSAIYARNVGCMVTLAILAQITSFFMVHTVLESSPARRRQDRIRLAAVGLLALLYVPYPAHALWHNGVLLLLCLAMFGYVFAGPNDLEAQETSPKGKK